MSICWKENISSVKVAASNSDSRSLRRSAIIPSSPWLQSDTKSLVNVLVAMMNTVRLLSWTLQAVLFFNLLAVSSH